MLVKKLLKKDGDGKEIFSEEYSEEIFDKFFQKWTSSKLLVTFHHYMNYKQVILPLLRVTIILHMLENKKVKLKSVMKMKKDLIESAKKCQVLTKHFKTVKTTY